MSEHNELNRDVWCILGLPFDAVDMKLTIEKIHDSIQNQQPCFLSTPNLNFLVASQKQAAFRESVIQSDLSIADGMPLIWMAKFLGLPLNERVPGSGLIENLNTVGTTEDKKIKVFFFGGMEGIAEKACTVLNSLGRQMLCVGSYYPGFGSVDDMSKDSVLDEINSCGPDFVIVSLGAKKGQEWIINNRDKINAPVISHLGAVVNFIAGNIERSPVWMQKSGLEWLWRIYQEPGLWKRYATDGLVFIKLLFTRIIPYKIFLVMNGDSYNSNVCSIDMLENDDGIELIMKGALTHKNIELIRESFKKALDTRKKIKINLEETTYMDSAVIGLITILDKLLRNNDLNLSLISLSRRIKRVFFYNGALFLLKS